MSEEQLRELRVERVVELLKEMAADPLSALLELHGFGEAICQHRHYPAECMKCTGSLPAGRAADGAVLSPCLTCPIHAYVQALPAWEDVYLPLLAEKLVAAGDAEGVIARYNAFAACEGDSDIYNAETGLWTPWLPNAYTGMDLFVDATGHEYSLACANREATEQSIAHYKWTASGYKFDRELAAPCGRER